MNNIDEAIELSLAFCPICGKHLKESSITNTKFCPGHGHFIVTNGVANFTTTMFGREPMWKSQ